MADAIARWRESKKAAATGEPVVEDEAPAIDEEPDRTELERELVAEALETPPEPVTIAEDATPFPPAPSPRPTR